MVSNKDLLQADIYYVSSGRTELKETRDRDYNINDQSQFAETKTAYSYNSLNYLVSSITATQSNGDVNIRSIRYSTDYSDPVTLNKLADNNILSTVVEETSDLMKSGNPYSYLNEKVTEFVTLANGDIKPLRRLEQRFMQPQPNYIGYINLYHGPGNSSNPQYKETQTFTYYNVAGDSRTGSLIGIRDGGQSCSYQYLRL